MASRKPLVRVGGQNVQLPAGDILAGVGDFLKNGSVAMTGPFNQAPQVSIPASSVVDIGGAGSDSIYISGGGTTINSFSGGVDGMRRQIQFGSGVILASGLVPGGAHTTLSGDNAEFQAASATAWRCLSYTKADGTALVSSGSGPASTDALPEGSTNLYFTAARAQAANTDKVPLSSVGAASGVAPLGSDSKIASAYLPSYVDDVLEYSNLAAFPATGETGKIYIALDTNREYRWSGSTYIQLVASPGTTDNVPEGTTNLYFTAARVLNTVLAGLSLATGTAVVSTDSILVAIGKLQAQSTAQDTAIAGKEPTITAGTSAQYWNGAKAFVDFATSVRSSVLTGLSVATATAASATDSVLVAIGKLQAQITSRPGKNLLINGLFNVNQRGYASGSATNTANQYTYDRWRVLTSGQSISLSGVVATFPAGGGGQIVEGADLLTGTYTLSWTGTGTATVAGNAVANGGQVNLTAGTNVDVVFVGQISYPKLEFGVAKTAWEIRTFAEELIRCKRYFRKSFPYGVAPAQATGTYLGAVKYVCPGSAGAYSTVFVSYDVSMRGVPILTTFSPIAADSNWYNQGAGSSSGGAVAALGVGADSFCLFNASANTSTAATTMAVHYTADAEL